MPGTHDQAHLPGSPATAPCRAKPVRRPRSGAAPGSAAEPTTALSLAMLGFALPVLRNPDIAAALRTRPNAPQVQFVLRPRAIYKSTRSAPDTSYIEGAQQVPCHRSRFQLPLLLAGHLYPATRRRFYRQLGMDTPSRWCEEACATYKTVAKSGNSRERTPG